MDPNELTHELHKTLLLYFKAVMQGSRAQDVQPSLQMAVTVISVRLIRVG